MTGSHTVPPPVGMRYDGLGEAAHASRMRAADSIVQPPRLARRRGGSPLSASAVTSLAAQALRRDGASARDRAP